MRTLADRMKRYEAVSRHSLTPRTPVIVRVDGRAFHTYTKNFERPFDRHLMAAMVLACRGVASEMQGWKVAYTQSDEASFLLTDFENSRTECWFDYTLQKVVSISAALMTAEFNMHLAALLQAAGTAPPSMYAAFDARAFNVPREEVANYFLWRSQDWERNSLMMYARAHFPQEALEGKSKAAVHDLLHGIGRNWATDLGEQSKNGLFLIATEEGVATRADVPPRHAAIADLLEPFLCNSNE